MALALRRPRVAYLRPILNRAYIRPRVNLLLIRLACKKVVIITSHISGINFIHEPTMIVTIVFAKLDKDPEQLDVRLPVAIYVPSISWEEYNNYCCVYVCIQSQFLWYTSGIFVDLIYTVLLILHNAKDAELCSGLQNKRLILLNSYNANYNITLIN